MKIRKNTVFFALVVLMVLPLVFAGCQRPGTTAAGTGTARMIEGANVPRNETIILENPSGRAQPADRFNRWAGWSNTYSSGLQQLTMDALWYIDPNEGIAGVWENALASEPPIYNSDFTEMTIRLRQGIYWSDGVQFTADDVVFTIQTLRDTDNMYLTPTFRTFVDRVEKINDFELKVYLTMPNYRFHSNFTVRWDATFIMPKHIFENVEDKVTFDFNPPISLGPYVLKDFDPQGYWYLWEKREDWQRTSLALLGSLEHAPRYAMYIEAGSSDTKVMSMRNLDLDVIHDITVEGAMTLRRTHPTSTSWFPSFPWGHPDPTLVAITLNNARPGLDNRDVRWAMTLSLDINRIAMASARGAMTISALHVPPTGTYPRHYFEPMEQWLRDFTLDMGDGTTFRPYNPNATIEIANSARSALGDVVPTDPNEIRRFMGAGWWHFNHEAAEKLMVKGGMRRNAQGMWEFNNGEPFRPVLIGHTEASNPGLNRAAAMIVEQWREFGIDAILNITTTPGSFTGPGEFDARLFWNIETWGGHPDLSNFLTPFHSNEYVGVGELAGRNWTRYRSSRVDAIIEELLTVDMEHPRVVELGREFIMVAVEDMFQIPISAYNVFAIMDQHYWTGYPSINDPYANPVANWTNTRYMYLRFRPTGRN